MEELYKTIGALEALRGRLENWDGHNSTAPSTDSINRAEEWVKLLYQEVPFWAPFVCSDESGIVTMEWYRKGRNLTIYFDEHGVNGILSWGKNVEDMEDIAVNTSLERQMVWQWLLGL